MSRQAPAAGAGRGPGRGARLRLRRGLGPLQPLADLPGPLPVRLERARCRRGDRADPAHDIRDEPDRALPPGQKAATVALLSEGRFTLGLGAGENRNEHVVGQGWQPVNIRHEKLTEAVQIIRELFGGGYVNYRGQHFDVDSAKLWDLPDEPVKIGIAVSGKQSCRLAGEHADLMIATEPRPELGEMFDAAGGTGKRRVGQLGISYGTDRDAAVERAHDQFRWFGLGWKVNSELPGPAAFAAASQFARPRTWPRPSRAGRTCRRSWTA